eukprot:gene24608-gene21062
MELALAGQRMSAPFDETVLVKGVMTGKTLETLIDLSWILSLSLHGNEEVAAATTSSALYGIENQNNDPCFPSSLARTPYRPFNASILFAKLYRPNPVPPASL